MGKTYSVGAGTLTSVRLRHNSGNLSSFVSVQLHARSQYKHTIWQNGEHNRRKNPPALKYGSVEGVAAVANGTNVTL